MSSAATGRLSRVRLSATPLFFSRVRARVDPSDVVQDAQLEAVRRLHAYLEKRPMPFRLWLRQLAHDRLLNVHRNHATTARRAVSREQRLPERSSLLLAEQLLASGSTPSDQVNRRDLAGRHQGRVG